MTRPISLLPIKVFTAFLIFLYLQRFWSVQIIFVKILVEVLHLQYEPKIPFSMYSWACSSVCCGVIMPIRTARSTLLSFEQQPPILRQIYLILRDSERIATDAKTKNKRFFCDNLIDNFWS